MNCTFTSAYTSNLSLAAYRAHTKALEGIISISSVTLPKSATQAVNGDAERIFTVSEILDDNRGGSMSAGWAAYRGIASPATNRRGVR